MIYISEEELNQVEYLISQSVQGHHVLFDPDTVRRVFNKSEVNQFSEEDAYGVEHHIENLLQKPTLAQKRSYLEKLDGKTYDKVVLTYFSIVENNIYENLEVSH